MEASLIEQRKAALIEGLRRAFATYIGGEPIVQREGTLTAIWGRSKRIDISDSYLATRCNTVTLADYDEEGKRLIEERRDELDRDGLARFFAD